MLPYTSHNAPYTSHSNLRNQLLIDRLTSDAVASLFVIRMTQYTNYFYINQNMNAYSTYTNNLLQYLTIFRAGWRMENVTAR